MDGEASLTRRTKLQAPVVPNAGGEARSYFAALAGVALLALVVRVHHLNVENFWQDEIHSMYNSACARGPAERIPHGVILRDLPRYSDLTPQSTLSGVWRTLDDDSHPPVYFMLLLL